MGLCDACCAGWVGGVSCTGVPSFCWQVPALLSCGATNSQLDIWRVKFNITTRSSLTSTTLTVLMVQVFLPAVYFGCSWLDFLKTIHCGIFEISVNGRLWTTFSNALQFRYFSGDLICNSRFSPADFDTVFHWFT